jgi:hypothetical protein
MGNSSLPPTMSEVNFNILEMGRYRTCTHLIGSLFFPLCFGKKIFFQKNLRGHNSGLKSITLNFFFVVIEEIINSISQQNLINTIDQMPEQKLNGCVILKEDIL